jgi:predicted amidohydrolase
MRIALIQAAGHPGDLESNLELMTDHIAAAAAGGAELVIFLELFASGYNIGEAARQLAFPADGEPARHIRATARKHQIQA